MQKWIHIKQEIQDEIQDADAKLAQYRTLEADLLLVSEFVEH